MSTKTKLTREEKKSFKKYFAAASPYCMIIDGQFSKGPMTKRKSLYGAHAEIVGTHVQGGVSLGKVAAGAVLAGPAGAIIGGMMKSAGSKPVLILTFSDGSTHTEEVEPKNLTKAELFVRNVELLSTIQHPLDIE